MTAALTLSGEAELTFAHFAAGGGFDCAAQLLGHGQLRQVNDGVAAVTDKVDMGMGVAVEALDTANCAQALDHALGFEQGQIPVHRGKGDIRVLGLEHFVQHLSRGMQVGASQAGENGVPLAELLTTGFHRHLLCWICLYLRMIIVYSHILAQSFLFVKRKMRIILIYFFFFIFKKNSYFLPNIV